MENSTNEQIASGEKSKKKKKVKKVEMEVEEEGAQTAVQPSGSSKRKVTIAGSVGEPAGKRARASTLGSAEEEEAEEIDLEQVPGVEDEGEVARLEAVGQQTRLEEFFPEPGRTVDDARAARKQCTEYVRNACDKLYMYAAQGQLNKAYADFVLEKGLATLADWIMDDLSPALVGYIGSGTWTRQDLLRLATADLTLKDNGCYLILCERYLYGGSTGNFCERIRNHKENIEFNRCGDPYAERKKFYDQCSTVNDEPRFIYAAVNKHRDDGRFLEVLESVLISIFDCFDSGRRTSFGRQVGVCKGMRSADMPERDWEAGNASLPVCMGYKPKLSPELVQEIKDLAMAMAFAEADETIRTGAVERQLQRQRNNLTAYIWCDTCDIPVSSGTRGSNFLVHQRTDQHQSKLPEAQKSGAGKKRCDLCQVDVHQDSWGHHLQTVEHQRNLPEDERDESAVKHCEYCRRDISTRAWSQHIKTKGHREACITAGVEPPTMEQERLWCDVCEADFPKKDFTNRHVKKSKQHRDALERKAKAELAAAT